jgi:hypothetical protein
MPLQPARRNQRAPARPSRLVHGLRRRQRQPAIRDQPLPSAEARRHGLTYYRQLKWGCITIAIAIAIAIGHTDSLRRFSLVQLLDTKCISMRD